MYMPLPMSISYFWNLGSVLGLLMGLQVLSGFMLSLHYVSSSMASFGAVVNIMMDVDSGMLLRYMHCNGSSLLFLMLYLHMFKGMYYHSYYSNKWSWLSGCVIYILLMLTAFLGYVLPWGQMSYWGATVISSLITTIPSVGKWLLIMVWGDYSVGNQVLSRFFALHFLIPFIIMFMVLLHLMMLHFKGSTTVISHNKTMLPFSNYFMLKDMVGFILILTLLAVNVYYFPSYFLDCENSIKANPMITPIHIVPEWYFLYAYCILKSFDNKVLGVYSLIMSVMVFPLLAYSKWPLVMKMDFAVNKTGSIFHKLRMMSWLVSFCMLTYYGSMEMIAPYPVLCYWLIYVHFMPSLLKLQYDFTMWLINFDFHDFFNVYGFSLVHCTSVLSTGYMQMSTSCLKICCVAISMEIKMCHCHMYHYIEMFNQFN